MSNDYYTRKADLEPFTIARADDVRNELDAIQSGFEKLPQPRKDGTTGFLTPFTIVDPTEDDHPATNKQVNDLGTTSTDHGGRIDNIENAMRGMGPLNARYTTLRYVATAGQTQIVLPAQFQSLAYVHKNGLRLYQTVGFNYNIQTKTVTFTSPLALNDVVLVDVGIVPDAVLADLIAIQNDINQKHQDVSSKHTDVDRWQQEVSSAHTDVDRWQQQVSRDKTTTVDAKNETKATYALLQKLYLGAHATEPTTDNEGNPLIEGASYYNTVTKKTYIYEQGAWVATNTSSAGHTEKTGIRGASILPAGSTADRPDPSTLVAHSVYVRGNTDTDKLEYAFGGQNAWHVLWRGQGGVEGDVVLGEHTLYGDDGAKIAKENDTDQDLTRRGLHLGDSSAATGQRTIIESKGNPKILHERGRLTEVAELQGSQDTLIAGKNAINVLSHDESGNAAGFYLIKTKIAVNTNLGPIVTLRMVGNFGNIENPFNLVMTWYKPAATLNPPAPVVLLNKANNNDMVVKLGVVNNFYVVAVSVSLDSLITVDVINREHNGIAIDELINWESEFADSATVASFIDATIIETYNPNNPPFSIAPNEADAKSQSAADHSKLFLVLEP